jgi:chorismate--pyruvate lyase
MKEIDWKPYRKIDPAPAPELAAWLACASSFMQRLKKYGIRGARIQPLMQCFQTPLPDERRILSLSVRRYALIREVLIDSAEGNWMYARTVIPQTTLTGKEKRLACLKDRALGSILFKDPHLSRSAFEVACLTPHMAWFQKIKHYIGAATEEVWARRSVFHTSRKPLLLTEIFFPPIAALSHVD